MNNSNLERRISKLEQRTGGECVSLTMVDGTVHEIGGLGKHFLKLAAQIDTENPRGELAWIRDAIHVEEIGGGMFHLLAAMLQGPIEDEDGEERNEKSQDTADDARWQHAHHLRLASERNQAG